MGIHIWALYTLIVISSFIPFFRIDLYFSSRKYKPFFYLSLLLLTWTIVTGLRLVVIEPFLIYYLSLLVYPIVFLVVVILFVAIKNYLNVDIHKNTKIILSLVFIIDFILAMTNHSHQLFIKIAYSNQITLQDFMNANNDIGFFIHTFILYAFLIYICAKLLTHFYRIYKKNNDFIPLLVVVMSLLLGLGVNIIHVFFYVFTVDPTLVIFLVFVNSLYFIFIIRDLNLILQLNNYDYILDNFREMYLVVDINGIIVDASDELKSKFESLQKNYFTYEKAIKIIEKDSVIYTRSEELNQTFNDKKIYLHKKEVKINVPLYNHFGKLILFYDETKNIKLMNDKNYLMYHDDMTRLFNRNYFESIKETIDKSESKYTLMLFDLDGLKLFNDYHGHKEGDDLLILFSNILIKITKIREKVIPIRLGGDEFLLIIEDSSPEDEIMIIDEIKKMAYHEEFEKSIGFSYGIDKRLNSTESITNVLKRADKNLYKMKNDRRAFRNNLEEQLKKNTSNNSQ
jgi:diguanylate cyclase (GGDEF)-like protein